MPPEISPSRSPPSRVTGIKDYVMKLDVIDPTFWTQGYDLTPLAFDELSIVKGMVTCHNPAQGGAISATNAAAHGCCFHDFGPDYADNFEIEIIWSAYRPCEATPLLHVNTSTSKYGLGTWQGHNFTVGVYPPNGAWICGYIGDSNVNFATPSAAALTPGETRKYSGDLSPFLPGYKPVSGPVRYTIRSTGGFITTAIDGEWLTPRLAVPPELVGSTIHGFAIDNNQTDGVGGAGVEGGGFRPPDLPAMCGPFTIRKI